MGPKKSGSDWSNESGYPNFLQKLCREEDVMIIPQFVTLLLFQQAEQVSPKKSKDSKLGERLPSTSVFTNESKGEDFLICESLLPPQIGIIYENPEDKETPITVICKNFYIEFSLINAIGKSLPSYPTITCLKIENCCISNEIVEVLASILANSNTGKCITELSLNGNEGLGEVLPLIIRTPVNLRYLSLQRCSLDDEGIKPLAESLSFDDIYEHKLKILNLSMNKIGNAGVRYLAEALRTNRVLISLSLAGNQIEDEGVEYLTEVLQKFHLKFEEIILRRTRIFDMIFKKKRAVDKYIEERKIKEEEDSTSTKPGVKTGERTGRKIRGPDGKIRCLSSTDKKNKQGAAKVNSGEKFRGKNQTDVDNVAVGELTSQEIFALVQQVENEILPDKHPFVNEVVFTEDGTWCTGCWSLGSINLAFNYLTEDSLERFTETLHSQEKYFSPTLGLLRIVMVPGNLFQEDCLELQNLQNALKQRIHGKEDPGSFDSDKTSSAAILRKLSSPGKWNKNR